MEGEGLGLILLKGKMSLKKFTTNNLLGVFLPVNFTFSEYANKLKPLNQKLTAINALNIFKDPLISKKLTPVLELAVDSLESIEKMLQDISHYRDNSAPIHFRKHDCQLTYQEIDSDIIDVFVEGAEAYMSKIDKNMDSTVASSNPGKYQQFVLDLNFLKDFLLDFNNELTERIHIMTTLSRGQIAEQLPINLETLQCVSLGDLETLTVTYCTKLKNGLFCELSLLSIKSTQSYDQYAIISYEGTQLKLPLPDQSLLRSSTGGWELLWCENGEEYLDADKIEDFTDCKTITYQNPCTTNLLTDNFDEIIYSCNFTSTLKPEPITRTDTGILFMGTDISVQEIMVNNKNQRTNLPDRFPVHIITNNNLRVQLGDKEIELYPYYTALEKNITYTYLTDEFIKKIKNSARNTDLTDLIEPENYLDLAYIFLFIILVPMVFYSCCQHIKSSNMCKKWNKSKTKKFLKRTKKTSNFIKNRGIGQRVKEHELSDRELM